jgi:hypothetical protein
MQGSQRAAHTPTIFFDGRSLEDWDRLEIWQALMGAP